MQARVCGIGPTLALLLAAVSSGAGAQRRMPSAPPRTVVGVVLDTGGVPVDSVEVRIASLQRRTFSDVNGLFRFDHVRPGSYEVGARRLGFARQVRRVSVGADRGGVATFELVAVRYALPPVVVSSPRGGLSGIVGDTGFNALRGVQVYVIGSGQRAFTDSAGAFFVGVKPGSYMVEVSTPGFGRKLLSVSIPEDSGRNVTVWMTPSRRGADHRQAEVFESLRQRMMLRRATARLYTREDLNRLKMDWLRQLVVMGSGSPVADDCQVLVDGLWRRPVYSVTLDEAESVEVYPPGSLAQPSGSLIRTRPRRSIDPRVADQVAASSACPTVFVWTRG
jgi:hypothetical protein